MKVKIEEISKDHYKITRSFKDAQGSEFEIVEELERSEVRELIGIYDNAIN